MSSDKNLPLDNHAILYATQKSGLNATQVMNVINLLVKEECTIPFVARYRKEATGNMDEVQIRDVHESYSEYIEIEKRKSFILETVKKLAKLTPELEAKIKNAQNLNTLEDLYAPYKSKRKTKAMIAKENGLEPLAKLMTTTSKKLDELTQEIKENYLSDKVKTIEEAIKGASDIIVEGITQDIELKEELRQDFWNSGVIKSSKRKDAQEVTDWQKFKDFFEFEEKVKNIKDPKNTHRFLAIRRGMNLKVLKVEVLIDSDLAYNKVIKFSFDNLTQLGNAELLEKLAKKAYDTSISTGLDLEIKTELKKNADGAAIDVFGVNLKNLLLQPYLGSHAVLGIDPGIRTGCKVVVIDETGKYIGDHVVYPFAPKFDEIGSKVILEKLIETFNIEYIAIGNGTNGRETLDFVQSNLKQVKDKKVKAVMINESGASIYSASEIARSEFPDKDVTVRGAISIARRFQDPLAELVKIDPKSIGVGQYQHDVNQVRLKKALAGVVENCVNYVGVDVNTASAPLLSYISGIGPAVAQNIVKTREEKGTFKKREDLLSIGRFTNKTFEQAAGFLRIYNGEHPLDATFIHPESYPILENWAKSKGIKLSELTENQETIAMLAKDNDLRKQIGDLTFDDIIKSLRAPKQDPRSEFKPVEFESDVRKIDDLSIGRWYTGVVNNITNFGAFVDLGIKESGLLHISQISDQFVENPLDKLKVGEKVKVRVIEVDLERKRIALSRKSDDQTLSGSIARSSTQSSRSSRPSSHRGQGPKHVPKKLKNNAFAGLANLKVK